jgi:pimeloyl-ACP methyl ester carboxylesterase
MPDVESGFLGDGVPYLAMGDGPPVVAVEGLTPTHEIPTGWSRRTALSCLTELSGGFRVYWVNRKQGLSPGETMSDIAGHLAAAVEAEFGEPVLLTGRSSGGSLALQLAVDRPDLVQALVVVASTYRAGGLGLEVEQQLARSIRDGDFAGGWAQMMAVGLLPAPLRRPAVPLLEVLTRTMAPDDPTDLLVSIDAELGFDLGDRLDRITAPTLVIGGARDPFNPPDELEEIAARVRSGRAHIYPTWGHLRTCTSSATANLTMGFFLAAPGTR